MTSIRAFLADAGKRWPPAYGHDLAQHELWALACHVLQWPLARLLANGTQEIEAPAAARLEALIRRRLDGEPLAYILGHTEFWSLEITVSPAVLVPRPETERLVEEALVCLRPVKEPRILDLGTGSGAIALALAHERADATVIAVDRSPEALAVAATNNRAHALGVRLLRCYWASAIADRSIDVIVSNPPYVAGTDPCLEGDGLKAEPRSALDGGPDGLRDLRIIIRDAARVLRVSGTLLVEHGNAQGPAVRALFEQRGFGDVRTYADYAGWDRVTGGRYDR